MDYAFGIFLLNQKKRLQLVKKTNNFHAIKSPIPDNFISIVPTVINLRGFVIPARRKHRKR